MLILGTRHNVAPRSQDSELLVDVDLAILGAEEPRFDEYEQQGRQEDHWVPAAEFRRKRAEILHGILTRPWLFSTPLFRMRYETTAGEFAAFD